MAMSEKVLAQKLADYEAIEADKKQAAAEYKRRLDALAVEIHDIRERILSGQTALVFDGDDNE